MAPWARDLAERIEGATPDGVEAVVAEWAATIEDDDAFLGWHQKTGAQSGMAGQVMVRGVEMAPEAEAGAAGTIELDRALRRNPSDSFLGQPFEAALEWFRGKIQLTPEELELFLDRFRVAGFSARQLTSETLREIAYDSILRILEGGGTVADAARAIREGEAGLGITPAEPHYVEMLARTNVATAYGFGRWEAMQDPAVQALRPYMLFVTAGDSRVRPSHAALNGAVVRLDSPLASQIAPPLGFNCRCSSNTLSQAQLESRGLEVLEELPEGGGPDRGWEGAPHPLA